VNETPLVEVRDLKKHFKVKTGSIGIEKSTLKAVDGVSLKIYSNETVGLVGESGCGKTTLGRSILFLSDPTEGQILFMGEKLDRKNKEFMRTFRQNAQLIFQDPYASLNPRRTVIDSVQDPLNVYKLGTPQERRQKTEELLATVGLSKEQTGKFPHELSGGQRQRAVIARAIILDPKFVVCDEPVSSLDVSIRSQVLNLMKAIQQENNISYLFISHDLSVVRYLCSTVIVMYLGHIVEYGTKHKIFNETAHPYTHALMSAIPIPDVDVKNQRVILTGDVPSPIDPPSGCCFRTRCIHATDICSRESPELKELSDGHSVACHHAGAEA